MNEQQEGRFVGRVVVITGSATGIGEATMSRFASEGASVAGLDNNTAENEATAELLGDRHVLGQVSG